MVRSREQKWGSGYCKKLNNAVSFLLTARSSQLAASLPDVQECDATEDQKCYNAGLKKNVLHYFFIKQQHHYFRK